MGKICVQPDEPSVTSAVHTRDGVPCRRRRLARDAQITLAPTFGNGMAHVDEHILHFLAPGAPEFSSGEAHGGDDDLRSGGNAERRWQLWLVGAPDQPVRAGAKTEGGKLPSGSRMPANPFRPRL